MTTMNAENNECNERVSRPSLMGRFIAICRFIFPEVSLRKLEIRCFLGRPLGALLFLWLIRNPTLLHYFR